MPVVMVVGLLQERAACEALERGSGYIRFSYQMDLCMTKDSAGRRVSSGQQAAKRPAPKTALEDISQARLLRRCDFVCLPDLFSTQTFWRGGWVSKAFAIGIRCQETGITWSVRLLRGYYY